ncbi:uncharacterized protein METZ01_LOCUS256673, partial [marine metagenome]
YRSERKPSNNNQKQQFWFYKSHYTFSPYPNLQKITLLCVWGINKNAHECGA